MHSEQLLTHVLFFVICASAVVCLKKDLYFCELSCSCMCVTVYDENNIDLGGLNLTLKITDNQTLKYQPCISEIVIESVNETSNSTILQLANYMYPVVKISNVVTFVYTNYNNEFNVILVCDPLAVNGNESLLNFQNVTVNQCTIELKTSQVCGLNLSDAYDNNPGLESWTSFFLFVWFVAFVYFVGGFVVNAYIFNEISIKMIPHHTFWILLYNKITDTPCGTFKTASAYECKI